MSVVEKFEKTNIEDLLPLTPMQESMLFQYLNHPQTDQYFEQLSLKLQGEIDGVVFQKAWGLVAETNEILRTVYRWDKLEHPVQVILKNRDLPIREYDFNGFPGHQRQDLISEVKAKDFREKIDLSEAPFRITLCKITPEESEMIISNHHILYDGWSNGILLNEFIETYNRLMEGREPIRPQKTKFREFIKWLGNQDKLAQKNYWKGYLQDFHIKTQLPFDRKRNSEIFNSGEYHLVINKQLGNQIQEYVKNQHLTLATVFYGAWGVLLQKYSNSKDVVFGTTVSGRTHHIKGINDVVGLFINTIPLRIKTDSGDAMSGIWAALNRDFAGREDYECTSLSDIKLYSETGTKENLFDSIVVIENYPLSPRPNSEREGVRITGYSIQERTNFDLTLAIMAFDQLALKFIYNRDRFLPSTIEKLSQHFLRLLDQITAQPDPKLDALEILIAEEKQQLLVEYNQTSTNYPKNQTLQELFEEQAARLPDRIALVFENQEMSYRELNQKANQLAGFLRKKGVQPGQTVGLILDRSLEMIIAIFGILKAGGAYLPLDHEFPKERILGIIKDAIPSLILTQGTLTGTTDEILTIAPEECQAEILMMEEVLKAIQDFPGSNVGPVIL